MRDVILNSGGNVVNRSNNIIITTGSLEGNLDYNQLTSQFDKLLSVYSKKQPMDQFGRETIKNARESAKNQNMDGVKKALHFFNGFIVDLARELSLELIVQLLLGK